MKTPQNGQALLAMTLATTLLLAAHEADAGARRSRPLKTGQTTCWDFHGSVIACAGTGQDGDLQRGEPRSLVDPGDGTIRDRRTALTWEKLSDDGSIHDQDNEYTWEEAFQKIDDLNTAAFAGFSDWRLPSLFELYTLVNLGNVNPAVSAVFDTSCNPGCTVATCSCTIASSYWSSSTSVDSPNGAWAVVFDRGATGLALKVDAHHLRAVRGGLMADAGVRRSRPLETGQTTCWDSAGDVIACAGTGQDGELQPGEPPNQVDLGDGTIRDKRTGLTWEKLSDDDTIHDQDNTYRWDEAFQKIDDLNTAAFAGFSDWRLPNLIELYTLVNLESESFAAVSAVFNTNCGNPDEGNPGCTVTTCSCTPITNAHWSSSTIRESPNGAWALNFAGGTTSLSLKSFTNLRVRAVRGGLR